jgi:hypothetical protein
MNSSHSIGLLRFYVLIVKNRIAVSLPLGKNPFAVQLNNKIIILIHTHIFEQILKHSTFCVSNFMLPTYIANIALAASTK